MIISLVELLGNLNNLTVGSNSLNDIYNPVDLGHVYFDCTVSHSGCLITSLFRVSTVIDYTGAVTAAAAHGP